MGFLLSACIARLVREDHGVKPHFDISGDLDTPVSAFMKLAAFQPRFLLESVEGGERLARYSFIGFGDCLEVKLDRDGFTHRQRAPAGAADECRAVRRPARRAGALAAPACRTWPACRSPAASSATPPTTSCASSSGSRRARRSTAAFPVLHYAAPNSLLVFDHLTRGIALLHDGTEAERQSLRKEVIRALRGGLPNGRGITASTRAPSRRSARDDHMAGVKRVQEYIAAGDVYQLVLSVRFGGRHDLHPFEVYRALRFINPSPYMYYCALGDVTVVGSSPEALVKLNQGHARAAADRGHAAARRG